MGEPHFIDQIIGKEIKQKRIMRGMSQLDLATKLGITFQQIQKYERGINRVVVSRLYDLARALSIDVREFFLAFPGNGSVCSVLGEANSLNNELQEDDSTFCYNYGITGKEILMLVRSYTSIANAKVRDSVYTLVKSLAAQHSIGEFSINDYLEKKDSETVD